MKSLIKTFFFLFFLVLAGCSSKEIPSQTMLDFGKELPVEIRYFHTYEGETVEHSIRYPKSIEDICNNLEKVRIVRKVDDKEILGATEDLILVFDNGKTKEFVFKDLLYFKDGLYYVTDGSFRLISTVKNNISKQS